MTPFSQRVIELALNIPPGRVTTYGALAKAAGGAPMASRSIGGILAKFPNKAAIPWHRIVYAGGAVWLPEDPTERLELYALEDIYVNEKGRIKDFEEIFYDFME